MVWSHSIARRTRSPEHGMAPVRECPWAPGCLWTKCGPSVASEVFAPGCSWAWPLARWAAGLPPGAGPKHWALPGRESGDAEPDISSSHGPAALPLGREAAPLGDLKPPCQAGVRGIWTRSCGKAWPGWGLRLGLWPWPALWLPHLSSSTLTSRSLPGRMVDGDSRQKQPRGCWVGPGLSGVGEQVAENLSPEAGERQDHTGARPPGSECMCHRPMDRHLQNTDTEIKLFQDSDCKASNPRASTLWEQGLVLLQWSEVGADSPLIGKTHLDVSDSVSMHLLAWAAPANLNWP